MRGGKRPGAGRKKGSLNKATALRQAMVAESGETPLEALLSYMRAPQPIRTKGESEAAFLLRLKIWHTYRFEAARAAAQYVHPRLAAIEHNPAGEKLRRLSLHVTFVDVTNRGAATAQVVSPATLMPSRIVGEQESRTVSIAVRPAFAHMKPEARKED